MAIVKMNKFTLLTFSTHKEELLRKLQGFSKVEFINLQDENLLEKNVELQDLSKDEISAESAEFEENLSKAKWALEFLTNYMPKKSGLKALEDDKESLTIDELEKKVEKSNWSKIYDKVKSEEEKLNALENKIVKLQGEIEVLTPYEPLDCSFQALDELKMTSYFIGSIAKQYEGQLIEALQDSYVEIISRNSNGTNVLILVNKEKEDETLSLIRGFGYSPFRTEHKENPQKLIMDYTAEIEEIKTKIFFVKEEISSLEEEYGVLKLVYDYYANKLHRKTVVSNFLKTNNTVTIQGWCPVEDNEALKDLCNKELNYDYFLDFQEIKEDEIEEVPIKLKNGKLSRTFESVTEMYSYPRYDEVDPTPLLVPFYLIFFGMMVADAGYGLVMLIVSFAAMKFIKLSKKNEDFARFFYYLSFPTIFFGFIYGSFFGDAVKIPGLIDPSRDFNTILALSVVLGVIQIFFGLGVKAYLLIRAGKKKDAFYDVGAWLITLISVGLLAGTIILKWPSFMKYVSIGGLIVGSVTIILTGGRTEKSKGAQIGQGLYALYGITGYVSDLVSYTRLMALGLAGGSIAGALNMLIQQLPQGIVAIVIGPIIFILAHIFNLLLSLLGAYVHTARLQYVEYFSKFYEGGGKAFTPFKSSEKYINLKNN